MAHHIDTETPVAIDTNGDTFAVGDRALHVNGALDSRRVLTLLEDNLIELEGPSGAAIGPFPAENYRRVRVAR